MRRRKCTGVERQRCRWESTEQPPPAPPISRDFRMLSRVPPVAIARRGTDNNGAVQKLLSFAVSDVSDDVRRAAVLCLGFVLMNVPQQCPRIVALLAESFNPHVR